MRQVTIRSEHVSDVDAIDAVTRQAFASHPFSNHTEHLVVRALRAADALSVSLVADTFGSVIGHIAASPVHIAGQFSGWFGLGPVSVAGAHQRQGVGSALVRAALADLQVKGAAGCVLLGNPAFYRRFGFNQDPGLTLADARAEHFMCLAWRLPVPSGEVSYHVAFSAVASAPSRADQLQQSAVDSAPLPSRL